MISMFSRIRSRSSGWTPVCLRNSTERRCHGKLRVVVVVVHACGGGGGACVWWWWWWCMRVVVVVHACGGGGACV